MHHMRTLRAIALAGLTLLVGACAGLNAQSPGITPATAAPKTTSSVADLTRYIDTLAAMAPGDPARQQATLEAARAAASQEPSAANRLRYALALGCAGHAGSDPIEADALMTALLAGDQGLQPVEVELATIFLREFDARVALFAELGRQRADSDQRLQSVNNAAEARAEALATENAKLRRALAAAERKLEAVAEMERSLLEQAAEPAQTPPPPPQQP
jgi:hypothetical protein